MLLTVDSHLSFVLNHNFEKINRNSVSFIIKLSIFKSLYHVILGKKCHVSQFPFFFSVHDHHQRHHKFLIDPLATAKSQKKKFGFDKYFFTEAVSIMCTIRIDHKVEIYTNLLSSTRSGEHEPLGSLDGHRPS